MSKFKYRLKVSETSEIFSSEEFVKFAGDNIKNVFIESDEFDSKEEAERVLTLLLSVLNKFISKISKTKYIVSIRNRSTTNAVDEGWSFEVVSRMYLADSDKLKDSILDFSILGEIYYFYSPQSYSASLN